MSACVFDLWVVKSLGGKFSPIWAVFAGFGRWNRKKPRGGEGGKVNF